jgi:hypothetical protein
VSQALSLLDLLVDVSQRVLQVHVVLLLVKRRHSELLVAQSLMLSSRGTLIFRSRSLEVIAASGLNRDETVAF